MSAEKHIEETPEMAKARKAKAALKNVAASTSEIIQASENMSRVMHDVADELKRISPKLGDVMAPGIEYDKSNQRYVAGYIRLVLDGLSDRLKRGAV